jgi:hypothetical protein
MKTLTLFLLLVSQGKKVNKILCGDVLEKLKEIPDETVQCCITVAKMVEVF